MSAAATTRELSAEASPAPNVVDRSARVSASGKALITGGYLILKQPNAGLVVATTSRFYTTASWGPRSAESLPAASDGADATTVLPVVVISPQFGSTTTFHLSLAPSGELSVVQAGLAEGDEPNLYILSPIKLAARALAVLEREHFANAAKAAAAAGLQLNFTLQADNDFYSQRDVLLERGLPLSAVDQLPNFLPYRGSKTGLGSSAALVSSLTGAMLVTFADAKGKYINFSGPVAESPGKTLAFVVAQLAHAEAQHSIGSGFDIASAVVGSCRYVRFSKARLTGVFDGELDDDAFRALILDTWDHEVREFVLPPRFAMLMGDVSAGSVTTSMSRRVLKWLAEGGEAAAQHWQTVADTNASVEAAFAEVSEAAKQHPEHYNAVLDVLAATSPKDWAEAAVDGEQATAVRDLVVKLRAGLRKVRSRVQ